MSETTTWTVSGMHCGHCVASVTEELLEVTGVEDVRIVLDTGAVTVTSSAPVTREQVDAAVREAGYALA